MEIDTIKKEKERLAQRINLIKALEVKRNNVTRLFNLFTHVISENIYLTSVSFIHEKVVIKGRAKSHQDVTNLVRDIDSSHWLGDTHLTSIKKGLKARYDFEMDFTVYFEQEGGTE